MQQFFKSQKNVFIILFGSIIVGFFTWYSLVHKNLSKEYESIARSKNQLDRDIAKYRSMQSQIYSLESEWAGLNNNFKDTMTKIPNKSLFENVADYLYSMIINHGLKIDNFSPSNSAIDKKIIFMPESGDELLVEKIPVDIILQGSFINFGQLLESMLSSQYRLTVSDIGINKSSGSYSQTIKLISYIYVQSIKSRKQPANIVSSNQKINAKPITDAKVSEKEIKEAVKSIDKNIKIADSLKDVPEMWLEPATEPIDQSAQIEISSSIEKDNNKKKTTQKKESKKKVVSKKESTGSTIQKKEEQKSTTASNLTKFEDFYDIRVIKSKTCEKVKNNLPINPKNRFLYDSGKVYCHSLLNNNSGKHMDIYHIWYMNGNLKAKVRIRVRAGKEIPAISHRSIESADVGMWKVEITDSDKKILDTVIFEVV
mgnify:CR=1 FL=1|tara:strand:+ start:4075 stop:5355 length:1281 start_codon:yes stop_codon:yes gene_type:complete